MKKISVSVRQKTGFLCRLGHQLLEEALFPEDQSGSGQDSSFFLQLRQKMYEAQTNLTFSP